MSRRPEFHISYFGPTEPWPNGGWALYQITGDEIARRYGFDSQGNVISRTGWPGYIGCFATVELAAAAMERLKDEALS